MYYLYLFLMMLLVGFLFKVSVVLFYFWFFEKGFGKFLLMNVGSKLLNFGEVLKFLVLNYMWKYMSGWINYLGMVMS